MLSFRSRTFTTRPIPVHTHYRLGYVLLLDVPCDGIMQVVRGGFFNTSRGKQEDEASRSRSSHQGISQLLGQKDLNYDKLPIHVGRGLPIHVDRGASHIKVWLSPHTSE